MPFFICTRSKESKNKKQKSKDEKKLNQVARLQEEFGAAMERVYDSKHYHSYQFGEWDYWSGCCASGGSSDPSPPSRYPFLNTLYEAERVLAKCNKKFPTIFPNSTALQAMLESGASRDLGRDTGPFCQTYDAKYDKNAVFTKLGIPVDPDAMRVKLGMPELRRPLVTTFFHEQTSLPSTNIDLILSYIDGPGIN